MKNVDSNLDMRTSKITLDHKDIEVEMKHHY